MFIDDIIKQIPEVIKSLSGGKDQMPGVSIPESVFRIQNVADYVFTDKKIKYDFNDVFSYMLPFPTTFFEFIIPEIRVIGDKTHEVSDYLQKRKCGILCQNFQMSNEPTIFHTSFFIITDPGSGKEPSWFTWTVIKCNVDGGTFIKNSIVNSDINPKTRYKFEQMVNAYPDMIPFGFTAEKVVESLISDYVNSINGQVLPVVLTALNFLHCKNVVTQKEEIPKALKKSRLKKDKPYFGRFYTLGIEPAKKVLRTTGGSDHNGIVRAFHICRGHLRRYDGDSKLFGKFENKLIWIPNHARGNSDKGIVAKDYTFMNFKGKKLVSR
jgi:hypothetical protein